MISKEKQDQLFDELKEYGESIGFHVLDDRITMMGRGLARYILKCDHGNIMIPDDVFNIEESEVNKVMKKMKGKIRECHRKNH